MIFKTRTSQLVLSEEHEDDNLIEIGGISYALEPLYPGAKSGKGGNSCVFMAHAYHDEGEPRVVKFCRYPVEPQNSNHEKRIKRFKHEIHALAKARKSEWASKVVAIDTAGTLKVPADRGRDVTLLYYTMEKAEYDLARYLEERRLSLAEKLALIGQLIEAIKGLHEIGLVHRDLKPDNILFVRDELKIGDLGLVEDRTRDYSIDHPKEKIGPTGFLTPEAVNKVCCDRGRVLDPGSLEICEKSDVFQLALIAFYILQGEVPVGCLKIEDLVEAAQEPGLMEEMILPMLQFRKERRPDLEAVGTIVETYSKKLLDETKLKEAA